MTTALRALLGLALLAGLYLLVGVVVGAAILADVLMAVDFAPNVLREVVALNLAAAALGYALATVSRRRSGEQPGVPVTREQEPLLWQAVEDVARRVGTAPPDEIRLVAEVNAAVSEDTRFLGLKAGRRRMFIGLPLLQTLTMDEMRAVLGHELGHYSRAHTRLGAPVYRGRVALLAAVQSLARHPVLRLPFTWYARLYLWVSRAVSRRQELEADALAVAVGGRRATAGALRRIDDMALAWTLYVHGYLSLAGAGGCRPATVFNGFHALLNDPVRQAEIARLAAEPRESSPYDSHPAQADRLAAIELLPEPSQVPDPRPAQSLLRDPAGAAQAVETSIWTPEALTALRPAPWEHIVATATYARRNAEPLRDLALAGRLVVGASRPYLDAAFEAIARGRQAELTARLTELGWTAADDLLAGVLGRALEAVLIEHGQARWTLSWSGPPRLLFDDGEEVALAGYAAQVAADPSAVPGLRAWLGDLGVRHDYVPVAETDRPASPVGEPAPVPRR
ncbi:M48 family metallopeptidase [Nonomuraea sp. NPDC047897]|uniref:M48 family metallopeptidase n=1 Tax=Nonomuraea sp. NPDC047897 TaxID=3364346 RepID=UPI0037186823